MVGGTASLLGVFVEAVAGVLGSGTGLRGAGNKLPLFVCAVVVVAVARARVHAGKVAVIEGCVHADEDAHEYHP